MKTGAIPGAGKEKAANQLIVCRQHHGGVTGSVKIPFY
jgi:hypothetical protein